MKRFYYLSTLVFVFLVPTIVAGVFLAQFISLEALFPFVILVSIIGSIWDIWATRHGRKDRVWLWEFNRRNTLGLRFLGLPIEEYLFYVVSSVYVIFMWEGFKLMVAGTAAQVYWTIAALAAWTLISIALPYFLAPKGDRLLSQ